MKASINTHILQYYNVFTHTHIRTYIHAYIHTYINTYIHIHTYIHTYIHKNWFALTLLIYDTWWPSSEIVFCLEKLYFIETILTRDYLERVRKVARHVVFQKASPKINKQKIYSSNKSSFPFLVLPTCGYCGEIIWQTQRIAIFKSIPSWRQKISKPALT